MFLARNNEIAGICDREVVGIFRRVERPDLRFDRRDQPFDSGRVPRTEVTPDEYGEQISIRISGTAASDDA